MPERKPRKMNVYQAPFGFYDSVVAAPNQAAALRAWGSHQNLFAEGLAHIVTDEATVAAAVAHPETPLRRPMGSNDPFELEPKTLPKVPDLPKAAQKKQAVKSERSKPPPPDRTPVDHAEAALRTIEEDWKRQRDDLNRRMEELRHEQDAAQHSYSNTRETAEAKLKTALQDYREAGGKD